MTRLAEIRLAAAIAHSIPDCVVELSSPCGRSVCVGFRPVDGVSMTPCALRRALTVALPHRDEDGRLARLLGLPRGKLSARVLEAAEDERHVGLGVFRLECGEERGFVFATLLDPGQVERVLREVIAEVRADGDEVADALEEAVVKTLHDPEIETMVVAVAYVTDLPAEAEALAVRLAAACTVEELVDGVCGLP